MKLQKITLFIFTVCSLLAVITTFTPLTFSTIWLRNANSLVLFILSFFAAWQLSGFTKARYYKIAIRILPLLVIVGATVYLYLRWNWMMLYVLATWWNGEWKTDTVFAHKKTNENICIEREQFDLGAFGYDWRTVQKTPASPLFNYITPYTADSLGDSWIKEDSNYTHWDWQGM